MANAHTAYREADVQGSSAVRLVVLLYEQAIKDLKQAAQAMDDNNIELRTQRMNHALEIIGRLEGTLDMERGGKVSLHLEKFYKELRANLWKAQVNVSKPTLLQAMTDLFALREAWVIVDRTEAGGSTPKAEPPRPVAHQPSQQEFDERVPVSWNG